MLLLGCMFFFQADVSNTFQANVMDGPVNPFFFLSLSLFFSNHDQTQQTLQGVGSLSLCFFNVLNFSKKKKDFFTRFQLLLTTLDCKFPSPQRHCFKKWRTLSRQSIDLKLLSTKLCLLKTNNKATLTSLSEPGNPSTSIIKFRSFPRYQIAT